MSAAVWNEPQVPECGRRDVHRVVGGGAWETIALIARAARRTAGGGFPRAGESSSAETA